MTLLIKYIKKAYIIQCKCKLNGRKCISSKVDKCLCECNNPKIHHVCEKDYTWNSATWSCENGKYLGNIIDDSVVTCNEK